MISRKMHRLTKRRLEVAKSKHAAALVQQKQFNSLLSELIEKLNNIRSQPQRIYSAALLDFDPSQGIAARMLKLQAKAARIRQQIDATKESIDRVARQIATHKQLLQILRHRMLLAQKREQKWQFVNRRMEIAQSFELDDFERSNNEELIEVRSRQQKLAARQPDPRQGNFMGEIT